MSSNSVRMT